jgi:hypothetical protein
VNTARLAKRISVKIYIKRAGRQDAENISFLIHFFDVTRYIIYNYKFQSDCLGG